MNQTEEVKGKSGMWSKVAIGGAAGILLGAAPVVLGSFISPDAEGGLDGSDVPAGASGELDDMSFADAFAAARGELGPGETFEWHGNIYSTDTVSEWEEAHPAEDFQNEDFVGLEDDEASDLDYEVSELVEEANIYDDEVEVIGHDMSEDVSLDDVDVVVGGMDIDGQDVYVMDLYDDGVSM